MGQEALRLRMMSARIDRIDSGVRGGERSDYRVLHGFELGPAVMAAANSGLVCDHHDRNPTPIGNRDALRRSRNDNDILDPAQIASFFDHGTVAIQEQGRAITRWPLAYLTPHTLRIERVFGR